MKPSLYLETTIPSYLTSRPSRDLVVAGHQQITREWWEKRRSAFDSYIPQLVVDEAAAGDPLAARQRLEAIKDFALLDIVPEVGLLAGSILESGLVPPRAATDAAHIDRCRGEWHAVSDDVELRTANGLMTDAVARICGRHGFKCPVICTPEELLGE